MCLSEVKAAEELMKLAINNQSHVDSLVGYYRDLIDSYNNERGEWVLHYNHLAKTCDDEYLLESELIKQQVKISDLGQELASGKALLSGERMKYFKNMESNGIVKKRLEESKNNYRELMNNCKPLGLNNKQFNESLLNVFRNDESKLNVGKDQMKKDCKTSEIEIEYINTVKEHNEKKAKMKNKIDILKEELRQLITEYEDREFENKSEYENALEKLVDLENKHVTLTVEYFRLRTVNCQEEKRLQEENEIIRLKNLAILQRLKNLEKCHSDEYKNVDNEVKQENKRFKIKYDEELKKKEDSLLILKEQHQRLQDIYTIKMKKLEEELRTTTEKLKLSENKTKVEVNSLKSQIKILKGRLEKEGIHELRREIAGEEEEDSSRSLEISDLEKINQEVRNIEKNMNYR